MDQIMIADGRPPGVAGGTFLDSAAVYGEAEAAVKRLREGMPENIVDQNCPRLSFFRLSGFFMRLKAPSIIKNLLLLCNGPRGIWKKKKQFMKNN